MYMYVSMFEEYDFVMQDTKRMLCQVLSVILTPVRLLSTVWIPHACNMISMLVHTRKTETTHLKELRILH